MCVSLYVLHVSLYECVCVYVCVQCEYITFVDLKGVLECLHIEHVRKSGRLLVWVADVCV